MWVKPHQKSEKCSEFPRFSLLQKDNNYTVEVDYGNPLNPNGTTVGHLDMNSHDYTVEFVTSTHGNRLLLPVIIPLDNHGSDESCKGPNAECKLLCIKLGLHHYPLLGEVHIWF
jgi:hypothetical protein